MFPPVLHLSSSNMTRKRQVEINDRNIRPRQDQRKIILFAFLTVNCLSIRTDRVMLIVNSTIVSCSTKSQRFTFLARNGKICEFDRDDRRTQQRKMPFPFWTSWNRSRHNRRSSSLKNSFLSPVERFHWQFDCRNEEKLFMSSFFEQFRSSRDRASTKLLETFLQTFFGFVERKRTMDSGKNSSTFSGARQSTKKIEQFFLSFDFVCGGNCLTNENRQNPEKVDRNVKEILTIGERTMKLFFLKTDRSPIERSSFLSDRNFCSILQVNLSTKPRPLEETRNENWFDFQMSRNNNFQRRKYSMERRTDDAQNVFFE